MKETTPAAMPPCFDRWCKKFDDLLRTKAQKREFRHYVGVLLGESERKNVSQMAKNEKGIRIQIYSCFIGYIILQLTEVDEKIASKALDKLRYLQSFINENISYINN